MSVMLEVDHESAADVSGQLDRVFETAVPWSRTFPSVLHMFTLKDKRFYVSVNETGVDGSPISTTVGSTC